MKFLITEKQHQILLEQKNFLSLLNNGKMITGLITIIRLIARSYNSYDFERLQSLVKQYLAGGKLKPSEKEMEIIRNYQKIILNNVAQNMGYGNWEELKNDKKNKQ